MAWELQLSSKDLLVDAKRIVVKERRVPAGSKGSNGGSLKNVFGTAAPQQKSDAKNWKEPARGLPQTFREHSSVER